MALYWYEKAADGDNYEAQEYLADVLYEGKNGYAKNPAKALRWNEACALRGHANAMLYQQQGDDKNAIRWYARYSEDHTDSYILMQIAQLYADHAPEKNLWLRRAADSLRAVARDISRHPEYRKYMSQSSTFYWRKVRGAQRQSAHSYGIAIDINVGFSNYWLWTNRGAKETDRIRYENRIPQGLVHIFERHGFIWGGRWYHYDTMHFEFRPEFL